MELVLAFAWITLITIVYIGNMMHRKQTKEAPQGGASCLKTWREHLLELGVTHFYYG